MNVNMRLKISILIVLGIAGYGVLAAAAYFDPAQRVAFITLNWTMVTGTIGLVLRDMQSPPPPPPPVPPAPPLAVPPSITQ